MVTLNYYMLAMLTLIAIVLFIVDKVAHYKRFKDLMITKGGVL